MVEAQLNIYRHFCSQTVAWGPNQLEVHVLLSELMPTGDTTLGPMPIAWPLPSGSMYSLPMRGELGRAHTERGEATDVGKTVQTPLPPLSDNQSLSLPLLLPLPPSLPPYLQNEVKAS